MDSTQPQAGPDASGPPPRTPRASFSRWKGVALRVLVHLLAWPVLMLAGWLAGNALRAQALERRAPEQAAPAGGRWVQARDVKLHVVEHGDPKGPVLVLVAGTGAWAGTWVSNIEAMTKAGWRVVAVDLPPFGFSERPADGSYGRHDQALRLIALIRSLGVGPVVLLGHSYGGGPAAEAAMFEPGLVRKLILVDAAIDLHDDDVPCTTLGWPARPLSWRPLRTAVVATTGTQPMLTRFWLEQFVARKDAATEERAVIYRAPLKVRDTSAAIGDWAYDFAMTCETGRSHSPSGFAALKSPLTLLWGELDHITPPEQAREIAAVTPNVQLLMLPGVGHIPQIEDPALFNRRLGEVLQDIR